MNTATTTSAIIDIALDLAQYKALVDSAADFHTWIRIPFPERCARAQAALSRQYQSNPANRPSSKGTTPMKTPMTETERASLRETALLLVNRFDLVEEVAQLWETLLANVVWGMGTPPTFPGYGPSEVRYIVEYAYDTVNMGIEDGFGPLPCDNLLRDLADLARRPVSNAIIQRLCELLVKHPEVHAEVFAAAGRAGLCWPSSARSAA